MLTIRIKDGESIEYGYNQDLRAICAALQKELGSDYEKLDIELVNEQERQSSLHRTSGHTD